jgi:hypothetical protein
MNQDDKITIKSRITRVGNTSLYALMPEEIRDYLQLQPGQQARIQAEKGKHGKYITLWIPQNQQ